MDKRLQPLMAGQTLKRALVGAEAYLAGVAILAGFWLGGEREGERGRDELFDT